MKKQAIEYTGGKTKFIGQLFWDDAQSGRRPGVVVFPEAFGLNDHARERAERLARLGYVALAADTHGEGRVFNDMSSLAPSIQSLYADRMEWRSRARAALETLIAQPQVDVTKTAAIGFCFGGTTCLELARAGASLAAIVTFHAGMLPGLPDDAGRIRAKVLICHGADDTIVKKEAMDAVVGEFKRDKVDWQITHYGNTSHSFTDPTADARNAPGFAYNRLSEDRSWAAMRYLFDEAFK